MEIGTPNPLLFLALRSNDLNIISVTEILKKKKTEGSFNFQPDTEYRLYNVWLQSEVF